MHGYFYIVYPHLKTASQLSLKSFEMQYVDMWIHAELGGDIWHNNKITECIFNLVIHSN